MIPVVTVFTPTYNRVKNLKNLYDSLVNQTCNDFEWLIVDDGSIDSTKEFVKKLILAKKINIRYIYQENRGKYIAYNTGVENAQGDYFICVDSDDTLTSDAISKIINDTKRLGQEFIGCVYPQSLNYNKTKYNWSKIDKHGIDLIDLKELYHIVESAVVLNEDTFKMYKFPLFTDEKGEPEKFCPESVIFNKMIDKGFFLAINKVIYNSEYLETGITHNLFSKVWVENFYATVEDLRLRFKVYNKYSFFTRTKAKAKAIMNLNALCLKKRKNILKYTPSALFSLTLFIPSVIFKVIRFK